MADVTITEPTNRTTEELICVTALITISDSNTQTVYPYFGTVVGFTVVYGATTPDADWDLHCFDECYTDLTDGKGETLVGTTTDYVGNKVQQFGLADVGGGTPVWGKITFGESGMGTASATATVYLFIRPAIVQRGLIQ